MGDEHKDTWNAEQREAFHKHLQDASRTVSSWPSWKQTMVGWAGHETKTVESKEDNSRCKDNGSTADDHP